MDSKSRLKYPRLGKEDVIKPMNIVNDNMSDTPETDAAWKEGNAIREWTCRKLERERDNWEQVAAQYLDGMHYYQGLVERIGSTIGEAAYTRDDGSKADSVLCAKVPELVEKLKRERDDVKEHLSAANHFLEKFIAERDKAIRECNELRSLLVKVINNGTDGTSNESVSLDFLRHVPSECASVKRERDEARKERDQLKQLLAADSENVDAYLGACIERDEARKDLEFRRGLYEVQEEYLEKAIRERDELQMAVNGLCEHLGVSPANTTLLAVEVLRIQREREEAITRRMETIMQCELYEQERDEAREENKKLREALLRVRTWGIESKNFSSNDNGKMAHWIDGGCTGELPEPDGPWIYERMEETK